MDADKESRSAGWIVWLRVNASKVFLALFMLGLGAFINEVAGIMSQDFKPRAMPTAFIKKSPLLVPEEVEIALEESSIELPCIRWDVFITNYGDLSADGVTALFPVVVSGYFIKGDSTREEFDGALEVNVGQIGIEGVAKVVAWADSTSDEPVTVVHGEGRGEVSTTFDYFDRELDDIRRGFWIVFLGALLVLVGGFWFFLRARNLLEESTRVTSKAMAENP